MMNIGVLINLRPDNIFQSFQQVREMELQSCQLCVWDTSLYSAKNAAAVRKAADENDVIISALWAGWTGPKSWNFYDGPLTLGLVPAVYRANRLKELIAGSDFAEMICVTDVITHVGFLPENLNDPDYIGVVSSLRYLTSYMKNKGQYFLFETGQETPTTLLRTIEDVGTGNLGINFDTANLIMYGKANSVDAAEAFGKYVRNLHCKDGLFPTDGRNMGLEVPLGEGKANIAKVLKILFEMGYSGPLTIEREISGDQQIRDIVHARNLLKKIVSEMHCE
jgi:hypothetical protein